MVETTTALDDLDALLTVEGLDGVYVGPGDLSLSLDLYDGEDAAGYAAEGATIVTLAVDVVSLGDVMAHHLDVARSRSVAECA